jgi:PAS domain S-box-containing protein
MDPDRNLLLGALALQVGLIDSHQLTEACKLSKARPDRTLADVLLEQGWILPADKVHLEYLLQRTANRPRDGAREAPGALPSVLRQYMATLDSSVLGSPVASTAGGAAGDSPDERRYTFQSLHGTGGIGQVWLGRDRHLDREVAIKELLPEMAGRARIAARFLREARLTAQLQHPGIVPVYELASRSGAGQTFYTMRLVRGRTLTDAILAYHRQRAEGRADPLDFAGLLTAFAAVCNTIAYAHSRGVLHRDLKGDNVVLGDFGEVIVLDWGLAKHLGQPDEPAATGEADATADPHLTMQGDIVGTPAYMAPEQAEGRQDDIDQRTDIYGLGAIFYEILTGRPPFVGTTTLDVLMQAVRGNPPPPRALCADVPAGLEAICLKALAKDPAQRYASAEDLAQEVQRWQDVQRRQAEDALRRQTEILRRSEERFELAVRGSQDGLWDWDLKTGEVYYSPRWKSILGYEDHEIAPRLEEWETRLHPDERERVLAANLDHIEGRTPHYEYEYRLRHKDGSYRWILSRGVAMRDESGKPYRMAGSHVDITDRKRAEEERDRLLAALRASEEQYRSLADLIPGIVWTARPDGWIDYANQFWFNFTGLTMEQTQGSGWAAAVHPEDVPRVSELWTRSLQAGEQVEVEYRVRRADGVYRWFLARGRPLRDPRGRVVKWFGMLTEVDQRQSGGRPAAPTKE